MKVQMFPASRKLMAVTDLSGEGIFLRHRESQIQSVYFRSGVCEVTDHTLEALLAESKDRTPIYEGDSINIQF